ncbi:MAG: hypothetical protein E6I43_02275 [Chloroflexi bacterium]|nr:MAG: hypothetical protein E6I43_02275 [Chloroflexota bacterium]
MLRSAIVAVVLAGIVSIAACTPITKTGTVSAAFDNPPSYPGYQWTRNGKSVPTAELGTSAGPTHCSWQSATILTIGWPLGTVSANAGQARFYIRDPKGVMHGTYKDRLVKDAHLPADARATGYKLGSIELYLSPADQDVSAYLVTSAGAERWPRADPFYGCA